MSRNIDRMIMIRMFLGYPIKGFLEFVDSEA